ncbi:DNA adenine methylase [Bacillus sp. S35]|uniref:DNA methyltransferase n=1 Tax=Priestia aryabhattai TaxID=412384 RepID=UPI00190C7BD6|nr:DNA methyltransferase [Priestia aryabhattai]MBK0009718.1 DNA adenine methylase [Bacillus sp. S35]MCM3644473.1 DNA adenine methylase [Priestia aryabhattai]
MSKTVLTQSIKAKAHTAQYKMHKYFARRPYNVFRNLIDHYTDSQDIVLDVFCGGGVTIFESLYLERKVIGVDLNPLATLITEMQIKKIDIEKVDRMMKEFLKTLEEKYGFFYEMSLAGKKENFEWIEWAYTVQCPTCASEIILSEYNKIRNGVYKCPNEACSSHMGVKRTACKPLASVPLRVKVRPTDGEKPLLHKLNDIEKKEILAKDYVKYLDKEMVLPDALIPENWDRTHEDKLIDKGINSFKDLFTERNYVLNVIIFNEILKMRKTLSHDEVDCLYFAFSGSLRYTNKMSRVTENWENGNPTSMDKHAYWLPNQYVEVSVLDKLKNRMQAVIKGLTYTRDHIKKDIEKAYNFRELQSNKDYMILNQSSSNLPIPDKSVSAVITDPPYGSNVQYGELSAFWNVWYKYYRNIDSFIYSDQEAIMNRKKNIEGFKDLNHYEETLFQIFKECNRVLKDDGYLVFTFNNKNLKVFIALLKAVARAGFHLPTNGVIFQDFVGSYKNTAHLRFSGNIHGDFIYSFKKGTPDLNLNLDNTDYAELIKVTVEGILEKLFTIKESYRTTELYEAIFSELTNVILELAIHDINHNQDNLENFETQSNEFIDNILKKNYVFKDEIWCKKEGEYLNA